MNDIRGILMKMKYVFLTVLHNMKLDKDYNKGISIGQGTRITNSQEVKNFYVNTRLFRSTIGLHSNDEFQSTVYIHKKGELELNNKEDFDKTGTNLTFYFLREAQNFIRELWGLKDNSIYVRDGFLAFYPNNDFEKGLTFKASLSAIFSDARATREVTEFGSAEIASILQSFTPASIKDFDNSGGNYHLPTSDHFYKKNKPERMLKAEYFTISARSNAAVPMKIVSYCTALEALFSTDTMEVSHKISERVALLLGTSAENKREIYKFVKNAYSQRSAVVHGSTIKKEELELEEISYGLDNILRQLLGGGHEVFTKNNNDIDEFFLDLLFT
jgi:Apea-like HEPN